MRVRFLMLVGLLVFAMGGLIQAPAAVDAAIAPAGPGDGAGMLTLLHNNDGESSLLPITYTADVGDESVSYPAGGVAAFKSVTDREIADARASGNAVVNVYAGDAFLASATLALSLPPEATTPVYDAIAQRQISYTAHIIGNHEFDYGPDFLERFIRTFEAGGQLTQPFLSANLDFSAEPGFNDLVDPDGLIIEPIVDDRVVGGTMVYTDTTGQRFGIVGITTPSLPTISSPRNVTVTADLTETVTVAQEAIDRLYDDLGVRKIIFVSHLQDVSNDRDMIAQLRRVDLAVAGGGDELLAAPDNVVSTTLQLLPGEEAPIAGTYPLEQDDADGRTVYIVTTAGNYKYLGRLDVEFDAEGEVSSIIANESYPRRVVPTSPEATTLGLADAVEPDPAMITSVVEPVQAGLDQLAATPVATTEVPLDVSRNGVRGRETNAGNLIADSFLYAYEQYAADAGLPPSGPDNPVIGVQNGGGIRQNAGDTLEPGAISRLDTINVLPFDNFVTVVSDVTPQDLKLILERSAASLPGQGGQFLQVAGISVTLNISNTAQRIENDGTISEPGERVQRVTLSDGTAIISGGVALDDAPNVRLVTNSFTARGGDNYPMLAAKPDKIDLRAGDVLIYYEQAWREYLQSLPAVNGQPTVSADDPRYQPGGAGRIIVQSNRAILPIVYR